MTCYVVWTRNPNSDEDGWTGDDSDSPSILGVYSSHTDAIRMYHSPTVTPCEGQLIEVIGVPFFAKEPHDGRFFNFTMESRTYKADEEENSDSESKPADESDSESKPQKKAATKRKKRK